MSFKPKSCVPPCKYPGVILPTGSGHRKDCPAHQEWLDRKAPKPRPPAPRRPVNDEDVDEALLALVWRTEPMNFGQWCNALRDAGMYPANKPEWASIFRRLDVLENEGLIEVERTSDDNLSQMILTDAGADRVRAKLDENRGLLRLQEEG